MRKPLSAHLVLYPALSAGNNNEVLSWVRTLVLIMLMRLVFWLVRGLRVSPRGYGRLPVFAGIELLEKLDIVMVPADKFNAHAIFQRDNGCFHCPPDQALQPAVSSVRQMNDNIQFCTGHKGMVCPDEESIPGEITRNRTIVFALADKLRLEPSNKPFVLSANSQKGS